MRGTQLFWGLVLIFVFRFPPPTAANVGFRLFLEADHSGAENILAKPSNERDTLAPPIWDSRMIWDLAPHNAFTDLIRYNGKFFCVFREGQTHVSGNDGSIRVIASDSGQIWSSVALLRFPKVDLRDPKISVMPDGRLMILCGGSSYEGKKVMGWHTTVMFSDNGYEWTDPMKVKGIPVNNWIFGITWHDGVGYVAPRICGKNPVTGEVDQEGTQIVVYKTLDGLNYQRVSEDIAGPNFECAGGCGEASIQFDSAGNMRMIVRVPDAGKWLKSEPPFSRYEVMDIAHGMGGPDFIGWEDGKWLVGTREYSNERPATRSGSGTVLLIMDDHGAIRRMAELPAGGDTSYPGMLIHNGALWFSYYSSHEGKAAIYLAEIPLSFVRRRSAGPVQPIQTVDIYPAYKLVR